MNFNIHDLFHVITKEDADLHMRKMNFNSVWGHTILDGDYFSNHPEKNKFDHFEE